MVTSIEAVSREFGLAWNSYTEFHQWSVQYPDLFWQKISDRLLWQRQPEQSLELSQPHGDFSHARWFAGGRLNYAENLLHKIMSRETAVISINEKTSRVTSGQELMRRVVSAQEAMVHLGLVKGDRVCAVVNNELEALVAMLACTSLGCVWSSCSPDFGVQAVLDRFAQIDAKLLVYSPQYIYAGKVFDVTDKVAAIQSALPSVKASWSTGTPESPASWLLPSKKERPDFVPCEAMDPLFIMFSSGTTGKPKCIVHSVAGTLVQHIKEHQLHSELRAGDRLFFYTTCGWMMWNWLVSALASGVEIVLYDGAVHSPNLRAMWNIVDRWKIHTFGTSPKFISLCRKENLTPGPIPSLKQILSTGAPLLHEHFDAVNEWFPDIRLASISGGTDLISCFLLGHPWGEVNRGELQGPGLGMDVQVWNDRGERVFDEPGELVCCAPFPSAPIGFWGDPQKIKLRSAYFEKFPGVWCQGDSVSQNSSTGGFVIYGRSDATLNPNGVRIGTSEIYRCVEQVPEVMDSIVAAYRHHGEDHVVLFLKARQADEALLTRLRSIIKSTLSPRHVPWRMVFVEDIPYTKSGKKVELAVAAILNRRQISAEVVNRECLEEYAAIANAIHHDMEASQNREGGADGNE